MTDAAVQFTNIKAMHELAVLLKEGGRPVVLLPNFSFTAAGSPVAMDLLLVPFFHSGYATRLFFERQIAGRGANWSGHRVVDRQWFAPSWKDVPESMPWTTMLCSHLRAIE